MSTGGCGRAMTVRVARAVYPDPDCIEYPSLLDLPRPRLRADRPETAIAEKLHAMVELGSKNGRMRDFFDIQALAAGESFHGPVLTRAIVETFGRRRTHVPVDTHLALTRDFTEIGGEPAQWAGFVRRLPGATVSTDFPATVAAARQAASDPKGRYVAFVDNADRLFLWAPWKGSAYTRVDLPRSTLALAVSPDGGRIAVTTDRGVRVYSVNWTQGETKDEHDSHNYGISHSLY